MVIIITLYLFRGALNFKSSIALKVMTYVWLGLNGIVILLIFAKNTNYIEAWGLTHKRIGVYIYSILCILGIIFTVYKLHRKKTTSFLVRSTSISFLTVLVCYGLINWSGIIVSYNLNEKNLAPNKVDLQYLTSLGPETYPELVEYFKENTINDESLSYVLNKNIACLKMSYSSDWTDFLSYSYSGYSTYKKLENYHPKHSFSHTNFNF